MVLSGSEAAAKWKTAISALGGLEAYRACGKAGGKTTVKQIAECMSGLKAKVSLDSAAAKYAGAYGS